MVLPEQLDECLEKYDSEEYDDVPMAELIRRCQEELLNQYPPTEADLKEKDLGEQRK